MIDKKINLNEGKVDFVISPLAYKEIFEEVNLLKKVLNDTLGNLESFDYNIEKNDLTTAFAMYNWAIEKIENHEFKKLEINVVGSGLCGKQ